MKTKRRKVIDFTGRNHSVKGIMSFVLGLLILISAGALMIISSYSEGKAGIWLGYLGFLLTIFSLLGFILGIKSCKEKEIYFTAPISGMILNGVLLVMFIILYLLGLIA